MKFINKILPMVIVGWITFFYTTCSAAEPENDLSRRDFEAVTTYINSKRTMNFAEKKNNLIITGDIRAQYLNRSETQNGIDLRGHGARNIKGIPIPNDTFEAIFNLKMDYKCDKVWGSVYLQFDDDAGIDGNSFNCYTGPQACGGSGNCDDICLKKAYFGYALWRGEEALLDVEIGRRPLYTIFDSRIQYHARSDGIIFKLSKNFKGKGDYYITGGPWIVDYEINHYAYGVEAGVLDFYKTKFDIKYSYVDWEKKGRNQCGIRHYRGWRFKNSQFTLAYNLGPIHFCKRAGKSIDKKMRFYSAFLINHAAQKIPLTNFERKNLGWYAGFIIGEVLKAGDWSLDVNYQVVQAQAVSECDIHGIGRGNVLKDDFIRTGRGKGNYAGWHFEALYAITKKLSVDALYEFVKAEDRRIGGRHTFNKVEVDLICAF